MRSGEMFRAALLVIALGAVGGCRDDWQTDMWYQPIPRAQGVATPRLEPEHSVPLGARPYLIDIDDSDDLTNPIPGDPVSATRGRALFQERCRCCHGDAGHGGGPVSKYFPPAPDLAYDAIRKRSDGHLYGTITMGGRAMPPAGEGLSEQDKWDLVNHVRAIQAATPPAPPLPTAPPEPAPGSPAPTSAPTPPAAPAGGTP